MLILTLSYNRQVRPFNLIPQRGRLSRHFLVLQDLLSAQIETQALVFMSRLAWRFCDPLRQSLSALYATSCQGHFPSVLRGSSAQQVTHGIAEFQLDTLVRRSNLGFRTGFRDS